MSLLDLGRQARKPSKRRERDTYYTPHWATEELLKAFPEIAGGVLLDPCCGDGHMAKVLQPRFGSVLLNDIEPSPLDNWTMDARDPQLYAELAPDWVVTNPPFSCAGAIALAALRGARNGVALLLRCTFLEPCLGREWLTQRPPHAVLCLPRISFNGAGTDSAPCWWFVWGSQRKGIIVVTGKEQAELPLRSPCPDCKLLDNHSTDCGLSMDFVY